MELDFQALNSMKEENYLNRTIMYENLFIFLFNKGSYLK